MASIYYNTINVLEAETGSLIEAITVETTPYVLSVAWSPDGKYLASSGYTPDSTVKIWDVGTWELVATFPGLARFGIRSLTWSPDSQYVAGVEGTCCLWDIKIWELETGQLVRIIDEDRDVFSLMWSPDGKYLASGDALGQLGSPVKIWDAKTGDLIKTLWGHSYYVSSVAWSPDGRYIASGSYDSTVRVWGEPPKD